MRKILLHGLGQTPAAWDGVLPYLEPPVLCPDLFRCARNGEKDYRGLYQGLGDFCEAFPEEDLFLCGLSLGGVLALHYAAEHPERVRGLVVIAAQYQTPKAMLRFQNFLFHWMPRGFFRGSGLEKEEMIVLCRSMETLDFSGVLERITCPVLVLCGTRDRANLGVSRKLRGLLRNARLEVIPGAGHQVNLDAPEQLGELLREFFQTV